MLSPVGDTTLRGQIWRSAEEVNDKVWHLFVWEIMKSVSLWPGMGLYLDFSHTVHMENTATIYRPDSQLLDFV